MIKLSLGNVRYLFDYANFQLVGSIMVHTNVYGMFDTNVRTSKSSPS